MRYSWSHIFHSSWIPLFYIRVLVSFMVVTVLFISLFCLPVSSVPSALELGWLFPVNNFSFCFNDRCETLFFILHDSCLFSPGHCLWISHALFALYITLPVSCSFSQLPDLLMVHFKNEGLLIFLKVMLGCLVSRK